MWAIKELLSNTSTLYKIFFEWNISSLWIISWFLAGLLLIFTDEIKSLSTISKYSSRIWGLLFSAFSVSLYCIILFFVLNVNLLYFLLILWISILLSTSYFFYTLFFPENLSNIFIIYMTLSFACIFVLKKLRTSFPFDRYFFRIISVLVNLIWVITFLFFNEISILSIWILLLWESVYLFFIYYSLRKNNS